MVVFLPSCKKVPLSVGDRITETRGLDAFSKIVINDDINVTLIKADTNYIEISAGKNLIPNITTETHDGKLSITNENTMSWIRTYDHTIDAKLYFKSLNYLTISGSGQINSQCQINDTSDKHLRLCIYHACGDIDLEINGGRSISVDYAQGSSVLKLHGTGNNHIYIGKSSYGVIDITELGVRKATVKNYGSGDCYVSPTDTLTAYIYNLGNIYYKGRPVVEEHVEPDSRGKVERIE